jgi:2-methylcitrate dehydratase PrpD
MMPSLSQQAAHWIKNVQFSDFPEEVIEDTKLRVLDYIGLILAAASMPIGKTFRDGVLEVEALGNAQGHGATILGFGDVTSPLWATIANGGMSHALDYDDTHNETVNHITGPVASTALSLGESLGISGKEFITTVAAGNELSCRIGTCSPTTLLAIGWHPTSIIGTLAAGQVAGRLLGLSEEHLKDTMGLTGSQAAGLMEHLQDGTLVKSMHPGWNAHSGMVAAYLAKNGLTGPATVLEGRNGVFRKHVQKENYEFTFDRMMKDIGKEWEILNASFKPYPCMHVIHPFLDALLYFCNEEGLRADGVKKITCLVADYQVPICLEPAEEKKRPRTDYHARFSLQYSLGAALYFGRLGVKACEDKYINDPDILEQVDKVTYEIDKNAPSSHRFKGWVKIETTDGRELEKIVDHNWGSKENPMEPADIEQKFRENALLMLPETQVAEIIEKVHQLDKLENIRELIQPCVVQK